MRGKQLKLSLDTGKHGGRRTDAGRRRIKSPGVAHRRRERVVLRTPLHINFKYRVGVRNKECLRILKRAILNSRKHGLRIVHFSLQHNHVHLIVESADNEVLTRGMRSLLVTFAKRVKKGRIQIERYHLHVLRGPRETKNAVHYVLFNAQKHGSLVIGEYSSQVSSDLIRAYVRKVKVTLLFRKVTEEIPMDKARSYSLLSSGA